MKYRKDKNDENGQNSYMKKKTYLLFDVGAFLIDWDWILGLVFV